MSKSKVVTTCDCGCNKTADPYELELWLTLSQHPERSRSAEPKLGRDGGGHGDDTLNFASIECLGRWTKGALKIIPDMVKSASTIHPRGGYYSAEFPTLWF